jgi:membrane associated rhomboid family serine protease
VSEICPICGVELPDDTEAWLHLRERHGTPPPRQPDPRPTQEPAASAEPQDAPSGGIWRQGYANGPVTMIIIAVTIAAWLLDRSLHYGAGVDIANALGGNGKLYSDGQWWRLITPVLVHFGPLHIVFNLVWIYQLGPAVERLMSRAAYLATYFGTAVAGNVCSDVVYHHQAAFLSGGASGAVYGLGGVIVGAYLQTQWRNRGHRDPVPGGLVFNGPAVRSLGIFFGAYLLVGNLIPHLDGAAHFGGGVAGLVIGVAVAAKHNGSAVAAARRG